MKNQEITLLLKKADELRALFVLGQRVIPFLEEIFIFVSEIQPLLDEINYSIQENLKKMPNASKQLSKVTEATEMATNEIMDIVDGLVYKTDIITSNLSRIAEGENKKRENPLRLLEIVYQALQNDTDVKSVLPQIASAIESMRNVSVKDHQKLMAETQEMLQSVGMDYSSIMMSLQMQDITSQQIAAVNNLLETVQNKLTNILEHFQSSDLNELIQEEVNPTDTIKVSKLHREIAFDPDAVQSIAERDTRQGVVDEYMKEHLEAKSFESASQDDIDALFAVSMDEEEPVQPAKPVPPPVAPPVQSVPKQPVQTAKPVPAPVAKPAPAEDDFEQFSQDDIDALFGK